MRSSSDYFNHSFSSFDQLNTKTEPRPSVPFLIDKIGISKPKLPPTPKVQYPIYTPPQPPQPNVALQKIQQEIDREVKDLQKNKPSLDQLIQNALKQKIAHEQKAAQLKVVSIKKAAPPPNAVILPVRVEKPRDFYWPSEQELKSQKKIVHKVATSLTPILPPTTKLSKTTPVQDVWQDLLTPTQKATPPPPVSKKPPVAEKPKNMPASPTKTQPIGTNPAVKIKSSSVKVVRNPLSYLLFIIDSEADPFNDPNRQKLIYGIKILAYFTVLAGVFELSRNLKIGLSVNGISEVIGIFLLSGIFFFFGENIGILFKPVNPYLVQEVV